MGSCSGHSRSAQANGFTTLPPNIFLALSKLIMLDMDCLPIQTLPAATFTPLASLSTLFWYVPVVIFAALRALYVH